MRARLVVRDVYAGALARIPLEWLEPIRAGYGRQPLRTPGRVWRGFALRLLRYRAIEASVPHFSPPGRPDIRLVNANSVIARRLFWLGPSGWEGGESRWWETCCARAHRIVEIGANIGVYTVLGAKAARSAPYVAIEPHPVSRDVLQRNVALNGLDNVTVLAAAVVGRPRTATMTLSVPADDPDGAPAGAFLNEGGERSPNHARLTYTVPVIDARTVVDGADLIKLDVEGYEHEILSSISPYVLAQRPTIFVEVLPDTPRLRGLLIEWMEQAGYCCYSPSGASLRHVPARDLREADILSRYGGRDVILSAYSLPPGA